MIPHKRRHSFDVFPISENLYASDCTEEITEEDILLGSRTPLKTILFLSVGPLISQLVAGFSGLMSTFWVSKAIGDSGIEVFGAVFIVDFISTSVSQFLCSSLSVRVSYLFGKQQHDKCSQLFVDFIRISIIFGIITPCLVIPITKPLVRWFGAGESLATQCFYYMIPTSAGCFFNYLYMMCCGILEAEGHSVLYGIIQASSLIVNIMFFEPIFLMCFKTSTWGASLSTILSETIPGIILTILIFRGKFCIKPQFKMFLKKFTPSTCSALKIGISTFVENISTTLPLVLMQKYINSAARAIGIYDQCIECWAIIEKLYVIIGGIVIGLTQGFLPAASYAYGARRPKRVKNLFYHALWLSTLVPTLISLIFICFPTQIASLWSKEASFLAIAKKMLPIQYYSTVTLGLQYLLPPLLQSVKCVLAATLESLITLLLPLPVFSSILYFTNKKDPIRIMFTYTLNDSFSVIVCFFFMILPFRKLKKMSMKKNYQSVQHAGTEELKKSRSMEFRVCSSDEINNDNHRYGCKNFNELDSDSDL